MGGSREPAMPLHPELRMTPAQKITLTDAALRAPQPLSFLDSAVTTFNMIGRHHDGFTTAWIGCLYAEGEIEALMSLRAAWQRGEDQCPEAAAGRLLRSMP